MRGHDQSQSALARMTVNENRRKAPPELGQRDYRPELNLGFVSRPINEINGSHSFNSVNRIIHSMQGAIQ